VYVKEEKQGEGEEYGNRDIVRTSQKREKDCRNFSVSVKPKKMV